MFRKIGFWLIIALLLVAAGGGYALYTRGNVIAPQATEEPSVQTAVVRRGSLVISASGSGSIIPANEVSLGFEKSGLLSELNVEIGDKVEAGDVLAVLVSSESDASLAVQLSSAELNVLKAQSALDELNAPVDALTLAEAENTLAQAQEALENLRNPSAAAIAQAELDIITAQETVDDAQYDLDSLTNGRGSQTQINLASANYLLAQENVAHMQDVYDDTPGEPNEDPRKAQAYSNLEAAKSNRDSKLAILNWYMGKPSEEELTTAQTNLSLAQAQLATAQETLEDMKNPSEMDINLAEAQVTDLEQKLADLKDGPDDLDVQIAEAELASAQAQLEALKEDMADQTLVAPTVGTILDVNAKVGDDVGTSAIITMADLSRPMLEVFVDETDMNQIGVGYEVEVAFDALPDQTFIGHVLSVDPSLTSSGMVVAVRGVAQLDEGSYAKPQTLPVGLNASVEIIGSRAENVLLVPVEALREIAEGKYGVFVMENDQPKLKVVEVGLMDLTYVEIISGLNEGDVVTTGVVETGQ